MLQAVIFDLDGVVVDSHPAHKQAWKTFFRSLGKEVPEKELLFVLEGQKREDILRHFLGNLTQEQVKHYGARKESLFKHSVEDLKTIQGLPEFLDQVEASGLPMALASSASRHRAEYMLDRLGFKQRFRVIVTGDEVSKGKPDPAIFYLAARGLSVAPEEVLVCEDAVSGVEAAKGAGMKCLAIAANGREPLLKKAGADRVVPDFTSASLDDLRGLFAEPASSRIDKQANLRRAANSKPGGGLEARLLGSKKRSKLRFS
jgi:beta-phosphoglucomutase